MINLYSVLGVTPQCSMAELKTAYRRGARETHPDHRGDAQRFQRIQEAYDILGDPQKRALYDQALYAWMQRLCGVQVSSGDPAQRSIRPTQGAQCSEVFGIEALRLPWPIERLQRQLERIYRQERLQELEATRWGQRAQQAPTDASRRAAEQRRALAAARLADLLSEANRLEAEQQRLRHEFHRSILQRPQPTAAPPMAASPTSVPPTSVPPTSAPSTSARGPSATPSQAPTPSAPDSLPRAVSEPTRRGRRGRGRPRKAAAPPVHPTPSASVAEQHAAMLGSIEELFPRLAAEIVAQMAQDGAAK